MSTAVGNVNGISQRIHNGDFVWTRNDATIHWECVSESNRKIMKKHVSGQDQLIGFRNLLLKDKLRVVKDMGWPRESVSSYTHTGKAVPLSSEYIDTYQQCSGPESEGDASAMLPPSLGWKIGAQHFEGLVDAVGGYYTVEYVFI